jgi:hypothetical protein
MILAPLSGGINCRGAESGMARQACGNPGGSADLLGTRYGLRLFGRCGRRRAIRTDRRAACEVLIAENV